MNDKAYKFTTMILGLTIFVICIRHNREADQREALRRQVEHADPQLSVRTITRKPDGKLDVIKLEGGKGFVMQLYLKDGTSRSKVFSEPFEQSRVDEYVSDWQTWRTQ